MDTPRAAVVTYRGNAIENTYVAHVAVVDARGRLLSRFGDPFRITLARSAAKPAQALSVIETGAPERFGFDDADIALMCASHSSEDRHIARTRAMLEKVAAHEADLRCGGHPPLSDAVYRSWIKRDYTPTGVCSNCSGKHVGMLAGAQAIGAAIADYHLPDHPMQVRVKHVVADACGLRDDEVDWAIDGCNLPTPAFSLDRLARLYASLADGADAVEAGGAVTDRVRALARIHRSMTAYPELVAGEGRYCTVLMNAFGGQVVGKLGADACYGIGVRASERTRELGAEGALGISVKIEDGNLDVLYMVVSEILERLRIGTAEQRAQLAGFHRPRMLNTQGVEFGHATFPFELQAA
ncbi:MULTISPECIES: asparaginase [Burkholderia]|uniref:L-asparaginase II n=1 Tax=Burkholderia cenocepacia (strain ATCC BAA-245 / DSM 16553 / LMG 16656 / NCTC 13227 / J2315 / CF5610) TaxID=216591 RepID=B4EGU3_BURCJ|nr:MULTISPECIES: asparaginase [Burkholderia]KIS51529.1 L-asparaginase II family protein [Burkholderia cepacia]AOK37897.1 asparaginase [Burkholderia cenocepacia]AQQ38461.1 asparaginase [Burkholderia cenocepacia]EPZ89805.1 L-asparaginase, thermolabile [Burkholderia cenocepacia K56-2Valvano]ERI28902.1 L-asparaginase, thermolabile [Burkholderia cenocepacia BC7]